MFVDLEADEANFGIEIEDDENDDAASNTSELIDDSFLEPPPERPVCSCCKTQLLFTICSLWVVYPNRTNLSKKYTKILLQAVFYMLHLRLHMIHKMI